MSATLMAPALAAEVVSAVAFRPRSVTSRADVPTAVAPPMSKSSSEEKIT